MFRKQAFSLLELLVVLAVAAIIMSVLWFTASSATRAEKASEGRHEYMRLLASLHEQVKRDVRSARSIAESANNVYRLEVITNRTDTVTTTSVVTYHHLERGLVLREAEGVRKRYDFRRFIDAEEFVFRLRW